MTDSKIVLTLVLALALMTSARPGNFADNLRNGGSFPIFSDSSNFLDATNFVASYSSGFTADDVNSAAYVIDDTIYFTNPNAPIVDLSTGKFSQSSPLIQGISTSVDSKSNEIYWMTLIASPVSSSSAITLVQTDSEFKVQQQFNGIPFTYNTGYYTIPTLALSSDNVIIMAEHGLSLLQVRGNLATEINVTAGYITFAGIGLLKDDYAALINSTSGTSYYTEFSQLAGSNFTIFVLPTPSPLSLVVNSDQNSVVYGVNDKEMVISTLTNQSSLNVETVSYTAIGEGNVIIVNCNSQLTLVNNDYILNLSSDLKANWAKDITYGSSTGGGKLEGAFCETKSQSVLINLAVGGDMYLVKFDPSGDFSFGTDSSPFKIADADVPTMKSDSSSAPSIPSDEVVAIETITAMGPGLFLDEVKFETIDGNLQSANGF